MHPSCLTTVLLNSTVVVPMNQTKNLVVQLRFTEQQLAHIRLAAERAALDPATWMRMTLAREASREPPQCWCGSEPGVHRLPHVQDLVGDRCLRATDWIGFAKQLPPEERRALLDRVAAILVPRRAPEVKILGRTRKK